MIVSDQEFDFGRQVVIRLCGHRVVGRHPDRVKNFDTVDATIVDMRGPSALLWAVIGDRLENRWPLRDVRIIEDVVQLSFSGVNSDVRDDQGRSVGLPS